MVVSLADMMGNLSLNLEQTSSFRLSLRVMPYREKSHSAFMSYNIPAELLQRAKEAVPFLTLHRGGSLP